MVVPGAIEGQPATQLMPPLAVRVEPPAPPALMAKPGPERNTALAVLESLARGEISVDDAETLLKSLE